jgi:hypothetical protein
MSLYYPIMSHEMSCNLPEMPVDYPDCKKGCDSANCFGKPPTPLTPEALNALLEIEQPGLVTNADKTAREEFSK